MAPQDEVVPPQLDVPQIKFTINGVSHTVGTDVPPTTPLVAYLRDWAHLTGTKALCHEGGCGICTVVATKFDFELNASKTFSLKSCQTLLYACAGWQIETIEYIGNRFKGYHPLQKAVAGFYGTQCGYCTPGFIMTMYGKMKSSGQMTSEQIEKAMDGNICRCTGYRPILDAFKSLAKDAPAKLSDQLIDIEESYKKQCPTTGQTCKGTCSSQSQSPCAPKAISNDISLMAEGVRWYRPISLSGLYKILQKTPSTDNVRLVVGNTGQGVFKEDGPFDTYIDTTGISDLYTVTMENPLKIGANISLARCIDIFHDMSTTYPEYQYLLQIAKHWEFVANVGVRNTGCWAGNLAMKKEHVEFPSDIFLTLAAVGVVFEIGTSANSSVKNVSVEEYLSVDMSRNLILSMTFPPLENVYIRTYKITQRAVNSHAYINAAFKFYVDPKNKHKVISQPSLYFGGVRPDFIRAEKTEKFLVGKRLGVSGVIKAACKRLGNELNPDAQPQDASPAYRVSLSQSLLYKSILDLIGSNADPEYQSGGPILVRPLSSGTQTFEANKESWPIGQGIPKLESDMQVSGSAEYLNDIPSLPNELHGAFVQTTVAKGDLDTVDATEALALPGVVDFISAKDIRGSNNTATTMNIAPDPLFLEKTVLYNGQAIGVIVAKRRDIALRAVKLVKVTYKNVQKPTLTIKEALQKLATGETTTKENVIDINNIKGVDSAPKPDHTISGTMEQGSQFHLHMEPLSALIYPREKGYDLWATTQWKAVTQNAVAEVLGIDANKLNMTVRRLGGAYGAKITRTNPVACAAAVACQKLGLPVRIVLPLNVNMTLVGWREPFYSSYEVGFSKEGLLKNVEVQFISDGGAISNETSEKYASGKIPNVYYADNWKITSKFVKTDTAPNTWCRTPGSVEAIATMENIIEHVASYLKKSPMEIRELNFTTETIKNSEGYGPRGENLVATKIFPSLKQTTMYDAKRAEIDVFNKEHRWRKKGLSVVPVLYAYNYPPFRYTVHIAIYAQDGTIAVSHGGVEMGQGINTKVAQMIAKVLQVPLDMIDVKASNNFVSANSAVTGGSFGSDLCSHGAEMCAKKLKTRLDVVSKEMESKSGKAPEWPALIRRAMQDDVDLSERYWTSTKEHPKGYDIFGGCSVEVEVDVLTGQFMINKVDVVEDVGKSMSPFIDVGQVEGSVIMGFGLYTSEVVRFNEQTGEKLSNGTWEYKVPTALDIPVEFNVSFLPNVVNPFGVVGSKATGEPAVCLSYGIVTALRDAIQSARADAGDTAWCTMDTPLTIEKIQQLCKVHPSQFNLRNSEADISVEDFEEDEDFFIVDNNDEAVKDSSCSMY